MEILRCKARLSVLWVFQAVGMSAFMFLVFMMSGVMEDVMAGEIAGMKLTEGLMVVYALFWLIPLIMAVLCLTLKDSVNRWLNFVLGVLYALYMIVDLVVRAAAGEEATVAMLLVFIASIVVAFFIAWFGWRLPKQEA